MKIKGFDKDLKCRGMQFEVGGVYDTGAKDDDVKLCSDTVYHYCDDIRQVHFHYPVNKNNRFCEIVVLGKEVRDGNKCGSNRIKIIREIVGEELDVLIGRINGNTGVFNSGGYNSGNYNSGYCNSGNYNSGNCNSGNCNSGDYNSGDYNSGDWNSCDYSSGVFCSKPEKIRIFNKKSDMTAKEFYSSVYYHALRSVPLRLTKWVSYTQEEMDTPDKKAIGGRLEVIPYKTACAQWWEDMSAKNKEVIMAMPNFDPEVFFEITGVRV